MSRETIDCELVELSIFDSCENSIRSDNNNNSGSDNDSFFLSIFSRNKKIMATFDTELKDVRDLESIYIIEENIAPFWQQVNLSSSGARYTKRVIETTMKIF